MSRVTVKRFDLMWVQDTQYCYYIVMRAKFTVEKQLHLIPDLRCLLLRNSREFESFLLFLFFCFPFISCFSFHMVSHHQLIHHHTEYGTNEWGKDGHKGPVRVCSVVDGTNIDVRDDINTKMDGKYVYSKANVTYENTSEPHPASAVKIRGPKSLAGFTA